jgi:hypothetical protein
MFVGLWVPSILAAGAFWTIRRQPGGVMSIDLLIGASGALVPSSWWSA